MPRKVKGSLPDLVFRALGGTVIVGMTPADQQSAANHVARKLASAYVKTRRGWKWKLAQAERKAVGKLVEQAQAMDVMRDELAELRMRVWAEKLPKPGFRMRALAGRPLPTSEFLRNQAENLRKKGGLYSGMVAQCLETRARMLEKAGQLDRVAP